MTKIRLFIVAIAIVFFSRIISIRTNDSQPLGRLLRPEEGCGISNVANTKIVGGTETKPGAFPWIALVGHVESNGKALFDCGGSLITSRHILTAAHCVNFDGTFVVRLGTHRRTSLINNKLDLEFKVAHVEAHSNHSPLEKYGDGQNDIAVLTLESDIEFNDHIRPICLPLTKELLNKSFVDENPFVAGWGLLKENGPRSSVLMQLQVPVIDNTKCEQLYKSKVAYLSRTQFNDMVLCAGHLAGGQGSCDGDSGGPLMLPILRKGEFQTYQIGIVAYATECGLPNAPTVYTRVTKFIDWIQEKIDQN